MMKKKFLSVLSFVVTVAVLLGALKVMNWLPTALDQGMLRSYPGIEEARARLGIREIYVPSYFPETIKWPPSELLAQQTPFEAVVMKFGRSGEGDTGLVITQARSADFDYDAGIGFEEVRERVPFSLKGREAVLEAGTCRDGSPCSRLSWKEGDLRISIAMKAQPPETIRLAESMLK
ncbi:MAG: hypothetical protein PVG55_02715 [Nitrospirota bacterium]|jgi:hypothetical protein